MEEKGILEKIKEFVSLIQFNGEKREILERALKNFLINPSTDFDIKKEVKMAFLDPDLLKKDVERNLDNFFTLDELFQRQDYILTVDLDPADLLKYIIIKFTPYNSKLKNEIGLSATDIIQFSMFLNNIYHMDLINQGGESDGNVFTSKKDLYSANYHKPNKKNRKASDFASFITKDALMILLKGMTKKGEEVPFIKDLDKHLELLSFTRADLINDPNLRFQDKPLLKVSDDSYIIINYIHLLFGLLSRLETIFNRYVWYTSVKGIQFEKAVSELLSDKFLTKKTKSLFYPNIPYGEDKKYELDGLLNFEDFSWFVECKSRIPRSNSFKGVINSVKSDLEEGIENAEEQALRAIEESEKNSKIGEHEVKKQKGILVIVEGTYPNLNQNPFVKFKRLNEKYPRYIIGFLTLKEILRQKDVYYLKKFLEWRSDPEMPIYCMSELDYWDYFTQMQSGLDKKEGYNVAKKRNIKIVYTGPRFNAPKHIKGID